MKLARAVLVSSRPLSWINTAYPFAAAYVLVAGRIDATLIVGTVFFFIPYNLLMYGINDVFDYESDVRNPRKGGVEGAVLRPEYHSRVAWISVMSCIPFVAYLFANATLAANAILASLLFAVVAYSAKGMRFKERPFLDSVTSSTHFVGPALYGFALANGTFTAETGMILGAFFLWGLASHAFGAVQDIVADREGGLRSIATVMGGAWTVRFAIACYLLAGGLLIASPGYAPWVAPVALIYVAAVSPWWNVTDTDAEDANRGWRRFLALNFIAGAVVTLALLTYFSDK